MIGLIHGSTVWSGGVYANPLKQGTSKQIPTPLALTWSPTPGNAGIPLSVHGCWSCSVSQRIYPSTIPISGASLGRRRSLDYVAPNCAESVAECFKWKSRGGLEFQEGAVLVLRCCDKMPRLKATQWRKGFFSLQVQGTGHHYKEVRQELGQLVTSLVQSRAEKNDNTHTLLLDCLFVLSRIFPLIQSWLPSLGDGDAHTGLSLHTSVNLIEAIPTDLLQVK